MKEWSGRARPTADLQPEKLPLLWINLLDGDAGRAYEAVLTLASAPKVSAPFLKERLAGVAGGDDKRIAALILALNDDQFEVREKAQADLERLGDLALPALHKALESDPPAETRRRAQELLDKHKEAVAVTEEVRGLRALEALERGGATEVLRDLSKEAPNALLKQAAAGRGSL